MYYIYGASGHGKIVFATFLNCSKKVTAFIDDNINNHTFCELPVISPSALQDNKPHNIHFAIGNNEIRYRLQTEWTDKGNIAETIMHPNATCYPDTIIGAGSLLTTGAIVGADSVVGLGCIINHNAIVDHDCNIGDFCHIAPSATLGGGVSLGEKCLVGAGAIVLPNLNIGNNVIIGAGAVVINNLEDNVTVVGCPARSITTK